MNTDLAVDNHKHDISHNPRPKKQCTEENSVATLVTFSAINEKVLKYQKDLDLKTPSMAFNHVALETLFNLNNDEVEDVLTDGSGDGGLDAIYINGKEVNICNFKYAETFEASKKNFPEEEFWKIAATLNQINRQKLAKKDVNELVWDKVREIWDLQKSSPLYFKIHICSNKEKPNTTAKGRFERELDKYKQYIQFFYYDQEDLMSKMIEGQTAKVDGSVHFVDLQYFEKTDGNIRGIVTTIAATDLIDLVKDPKNEKQLNENAFSENVRVYIKRKDNSINEDIYSTALADKNFQFWYLNNGITIVCDECSFTPDCRTPIAELKNLQIVNGGQTTHALFEAFSDNPEKIKKVLLLVRICVTKDSTISQRIGETTNKQTPIRTRDLHANERIQLVLENQFKTLGYFYERKKNQYAGQAPSQRLNNEILAQLYLAYYLDKPSEAKNQKSLVFGDQYSSIFNEAEISAEKMLIPYKIFLPLEKMKKEIQSKKRNREDIQESQAYISRATFHLLNAARYISEKEKLDISTDVGIQLAIEKAIVYVGEIALKEAEKRGDSYTHDKFFKEAPTNDIIKNYILGKYPPQ